MNTRQLLCTAIAAMGIVMPSVDLLNGAAFCALRDPVTSINYLYPNSDGFRSVVKSVDKATKQFVSSKVPFGLHKRELGMHTIYMALEKSELVGVVHVRSEQSPWGILEIAWGVDPELTTIAGYDFQRCRDPNKDILRNKEFQELIMNKNIDQLSQLITESGEFINPSDSNLPEKAFPLIGTLLRSAIKTLLVTRYVYQDEIAEYRKSE